MDECYCGRSTSLVLKCGDTCSKSCDKSLILNVVCDNIARRYRSPSVITVSMATNDNGWGRSGRGIGYM